MPEGRKSEDPGTQARILLVDDHAVLRTALAQMLGREKDLAICGEAGSAIEAREAVARLLPDMAIVDIALDKDLGGIELIQDLAQSSPHVCLLVLSMFDGEVFAERALRAGARGYVMKSEPPETLLLAIRTVLRGEMYLRGELATRLVSKTVGSPGGKDGGSLDVLTNRELQVLQLIGRGYGTTKIARNLHISVKTVETHRARVKTKLSLPDAAALTETAIRWFRGLETP